MIMYYSLLYWVAFWAVGELYMLSVRSAAEY